MSSPEQQPGNSSADLTRRPASALIAHPIGWDGTTQALVLDSLGIDYTSRPFPQLTETCIFLGGACFKGAGGLAALELCYTELGRLPSCQ